MSPSSPRISGKDVEQALRAWKQYLNGALPDGPFRPFHRSFVDFLLDGKENINYHIDGVSMHRRIADHYLSRQDSEGPGHKWDDVTVPLPFFAPVRSTGSGALSSIPVRTTLQAIHRCEISTLLLVSFSSSGYRTGSSHGTRGTCQLH